MEKRYENEIVGFNNRMTDIHAAIGRVQLTSLAERTEKRKENANFFNKNLTTVSTPFIHPEAEHVFHQYTVRTPDRDSLIDLLTKEEIGHGIYYPIPVHELPSFAKEFDLPNTRIAAEEVLSLPVHPFLTEEEKSRIVEVINTWN